MRIHLLPALLCGLMLTACGGKATKTKEPVKDKDSCSTADAVQVRGFATVPNPEVGAQIAHPSTGSANGQKRCCVNGKLVARGTDPACPVYYSIAGAGMAQTAEQAAAIAAAANAALNAGAALASDGTSYTAPRSPASGSPPKAGVSASSVSAANGNP